MIALIDYKAGNLTSVRKALAAIQADVFTPETPGDLAKAVGIIVPGVGHFGATRALDREWVDAILDRIGEGAPLLGICLGMQWLYEGSDEAPELSGLGLFSGRCYRLGDTSHAAPDTPHPAPGTPHLAPRTSHPAPLCPKCGCDDESMLEPIDAAKWFCNNCSHDWTLRHRAPRFRSIDDLVARAGLRRDELVTLADIGALNAFGYDRRSALWQAERAIRPSGDLFREEETAEDAKTAEIFFENENSAFSAVSAVPSDREAPCPLKPMTEAERLVADYAGMGLTADSYMPGFPFRSFSQVWSGQATYWTACTRNDLSSLLKLNGRK
jgi:hypothetical protein